MFTCIKTIDIAASHILSLPYESKCNRMHGHNYRIRVYCQAEDIQVQANDGMVVDFSKINKIVKGRLDHYHLNDILPYHPTAENLAYWIWQQLDVEGINCFQVEVDETDANHASFRPVSIAPWTTGDQE